MSKTIHTKTRTWATDNKFELGWCRVEVEFSPHRNNLTICGSEGFVLLRRRHLDPNDEVMWATNRRIYVVEGVGQITYSIEKRFPEMKLFMQYHQAKIADVPPPAVKWLKRFCCKVVTE